MNINFASAFQSVQASGSLTTNKVATASTMANNVGLRADVLTINGQSISSGAYQRVMYQPIGMNTFTQEEWAQINTVRTEWNTEQQQFAANPQVITFSTYFGDTLISTTTKKTA